MGKGRSGIDGGRNVLQQLDDVLETAAHLAGQIATDKVLGRLVAAFRLMPIEDREIVVKAIEHEVQARRLSRATEGATGQSMHANPHARLYLRSHQRAVPRDLLERDELMLAMLNMKRLTPMLLVPEVHGSWVDGTRAALEHLEPEMRRAVAGLMREMLAMVDEDVAAAPVDRRERSAS